MIGENLKLYDYTFGEKSVRSNNFVAHSTNNIRNMEKHGERLDLMEENHKETAADATSEASKSGKSDSIVLF